MVAQVTPRTTILSLPVELRLQIAAYALEQPANPGLHAHRADYNGLIDLTYRSASNLSILLVCRQFYQDFASLAFRMTTFVLNGDISCSLHSQPETTLRNLRKLSIGKSGWNSVQQWHNYPFDNENLQLDVLSLVLDTKDPDPTTRLLRCLRHVRIVRIFPTADKRFHAHHFAQLVGAMYQEDHYHRYDAPDAPNVGNTLFEPHFNSDDGSFDLVAKEPTPVMAEEDYMVMMKPKINRLMEWASGLSDSAT
ncbi:hypothetical protein CC86DRAFT_146290 [Ophiobolus disseminans]|uniref:F-box domain-containing protein n=1 Tax=Ophiobolus disseminans TaxID=1469910 RepID=A0A6A6ZEN0_9PLEO|nr:hypothetical protein CC86DRAFT_146290 [Ophiobolus disseminans]